MDYRQPHGYLTPPPVADPYQRPPPSVPPPPPNHPWPYSAAQFQYQPQTQHSPSPPPPQWPPPHSYEHAPYAPHPPPIPPHYPAHQLSPYPAHPHYPSPHPLPPRPPHVPQSYSQDWGSDSWSHHQSRQYPLNDNEEDWGAKAKAWLAAKAATENQYPSSQFLPAGRPEEHNHFHDQYSQSNDPQFLDVHTQLAPASNYQQYSSPVGPPDRTDQLPDSQFISCGQSSYAADMHVPFAARDGRDDSIAPLNPLVHQQEVPSSYSSVAGNEEAGDRYEKINSSSSLLVAPLSQHHTQPLPPAGGRSGWMEERHNFGSMPAVCAPDLCDQPLKFAPHFNRNLDQHAQPNYTRSLGGPIRGGDPNVAISSNYAWTPSTAQGAVYPPVSPSILPGPQVDRPIAMPSPASGHSAPMFPTGPTFQPTVPMMGAAFGVGAGVTPRPTAFLGDAYGVSERPKKASVPNWLREEIIKNKAVITSSAPDIPKDDSQSIEEDSIDKSSRKGYQVDSKSIDSSRSTEDEDEDEVEAARTAAINQEIKRVLTEVLLKVTDELFDEIATKVLKEDDLSVEVGRDVDLSNNQILPSTRSVLTPKASAKILIPTKIKEGDYEDASEKSTSGTPGDVLGLGSYASDEEDEETQSSVKLNSKESSTHQQSSSSKLVEGNPLNENGGSPEATEEQRNFPAKLDSHGTGRKSPVSATHDSSVANMELSAKREAKDIASSDDRRSSKILCRIKEDEPNVSKLNNSLGENAVERNEDQNSDDRRLKNDTSGIQDTRNRYDKNDILENKRSSAKNDHKDSESSKERLGRKGDEEHGRHSRTERTDDHDSSKDKGKEKGRTDEKVKNIESRKRISPSGGEEGATETPRDKRASGKKDYHEKRQDIIRDEKRERSRHKSEYSRHKWRHSSSVGVRESKDNPVVSRANDSSDESSDDSRRKLHHSKRRKSPSPIRSRKRQVSRSPHSKHSKRRHSPYSSLETTRAKRSTSRSRSRSPVHRRRQ